MRTDEIAEGAGKMEHVVGISEMAVSSAQADSFVTYALGSCIGVTIYDPVAAVGGLIHCMLPLSKIDPEKSLERPSMFVDTGIVALLEELFNRGAKKADLVTCAAGGARMLAMGSGFDIGERNQTVLRKILWKNGIPISAEDLGGVSARTMHLKMGTGATILRTDGKEVKMH